LSRFAIPERFDTRQLDTLMADYRVLYYPDFSPDPVWLRRIPLRHPQENDMLS
jgi:hypothetical protein